MSELLPLHRLVILEPIVAPTMAGDLHLPASAAPNYSSSARGKIVDIAIDVSMGLRPLSVGDIVHYRRGEAVVIKHEGKELIVVPYRDLLAREISQD